MPYGLEPQKPAYPLPACDSRRKFDRTTHIQNDPNSTSPANIWASSTNIKERLDYSCAVFDRDGGLVANAPHIPVHLGAMGATVRAVRAAIPDLGPGDAIVTNDPACGGSHLPDVTVVSPVFARDELRFFVASRGHHADIGGVTPGSMPAHSRTLAEEHQCFSFTHQHSPLLICP